MVLHGRIEDFLHIGGQAMDFIDEQNVPWFQIGQYGRQVSGLGQDRPRGGAEIHPQLPGDNLGQGGLAQPRRPEQQDVIEGLAPGLGGVDKDREIALGLGLTHEFGQGLRPQGAVRRVQWRRLARDQPFIHRPSSCRPALIRAWTLAASPRRRAACSTTRRALISATPRLSRAATASPTADGIGGAVAV